MIRSITISTVSAAAIFAGGGALAQSSGDVLEGQDAFGGFRQDDPGVTRLLTPDDLPEPDQSESASNAPTTIAPPEGAMPEVAEGFSVEKVADGIEEPRAMEFAPNGDLFVANSGADELLVYSFGENGEATEHVFATEGLNRPYGIAFHPAENPEWVYVGNADGIVRFPYAEGDREASGSPETLVEGIPSSYHWTRGLTFSADGETLYYAVGSGSNVAEQMDPGNPPSEDWIDNHPLGAIWGAEELRADVLAFDPDGSNQRIYATGLRNCSGITTQPATGDVWCVVNERDGLGDNVPFDYATRVQEGRFYGWPWYYMGGNEDPRLEGQRPDLADQVTDPDVNFQSHSAPLNIAFQGDQWGEEYAGDAFVALHGSWNRDNRTGYKVVQLNFADGEAEGSYTDFLTGFVTDEGEVWGRPVGVAVGPDGTLYVSEDANGSIWRVTQNQ